ncbi:TAXI family TRAP transporter solute-binding subunit [Comamonas faecalis]|uniref:TAXI family TRAP transporter solute-binding subunit n=1 Tax=Comamonas faecalis TaxID=1387849 RepID=A0ABP7QX39_9BURK
MSITRRQTLQAGASLAALAGLGHSGMALAQSGLPSTMVWSTYDVGSTGYVEASAIADAFGKKYGTRVRLQPSGSAIGRIQPVLRKRVPFGWLANEVFFASEGLYEFCTPEWGPQDLRVLAGRVNSLSIVVTAASGIKTAADLKGKRFAIARSNTSVNAKVEPILAFGGLTWDDLDLVDVPSYGASGKALIEGRADAAGFAPAAAVLRELEASPQGIGWIPMPPENKEGWARAQRVVPFIEPYQEGLGAGLSAEHPVWMIGYRYPMITVPTDASADSTYAMLKAVAESFDLYKDAAPIMPRWDIKKSGTPPMDAPFHDGAIRYLKEIGLWNDQAQAWQDGMLKRHAALKAAWKAMMATPQAKGADGDGLRALWDGERAKALAAL